MSRRIVTLAFEKSGAYFTTHTRYIDINVMSRGVINNRMEKLWQNKAPTKSKVFNKKKWQGNSKCCLCWVP